MALVVVPTEIDEITSILSQNMDKNFIQRILSPKKYPTIPWGKNKVATHQMRDAEIDGKFISYPNIIQNKEGELELLSDEDALDYALRTGEFVSFPTQEKATWFSENYKKFWNKNTGS